MRRIRERESDIRKLKKNIEEQERTLARIETGESLTNWKGEPVSAESVQQGLDHWLDRLEVKLDELGFYQECLDALGGVSFSKENIKPGYIVKVQRFGNGEVLSTGPKNCKIIFRSFPLTVPYAEILEVVKKPETGEVGKAPEETPTAMTPEEFAASIS